MDLFCSSKYYDEIHSPCLQHSPRAHIKHKQTYKNIILRWAILITDGLRIAHLKIAPQWAILTVIIPIDVFQLFIYWQTVPFIRACLCYFFSQTVLIFGMQTRSACATTNLLNVNIHSLCNCAFFGLCICTACGASTVCCMCN